MTIHGGSEARLTVKCSFQNPLRDAEGIRVVTKQILGTHAFHESIKANPLCPTHRRCSLERTMWRFHLDGFCIQCCNFSTDLEGRARTWSPFASGHLQLQLVSAHRLMRGVSLITNASFYLYHSPFVASYLSSRSARAIQI